LRASNTTTLVFLTFTVNWRSQQKACKTFSCVYNPAGVCDMRAKPSAYKSKQSNTYYQWIIPTNMLFLVTTLLGIASATNNLHGASMQLECPMFEIPMLVMCLLHLFKLHQNEKNIWPTTQIFNFELFNYWLLICRAYIFCAFIMLLTKLMLNNAFVYVSLYMNTLFFPNW
jgi:hypothetical protein